LSSEEREGNNPSSNLADFFILFYFERKPFFQKLPFVLKDSLQYCSWGLGFKEGLLTVFVGMSYIRIRPFEGQ
jgi:hypothetical protein